MSAAPDASAALRSIADAVLYEGYVLWPYRRSALKNRKRWSFGAVHPQAWSRAQREGDRWQIRAECLLEAQPAAAIDVELRFLHVVERRVALAGPGRLQFVDDLEVNGERILAWDEACERTVRAPDLELSALREVRRVPVHVDAGYSEEFVRSSGDRAGAIVRSWDGLRGSLEIECQPLESGLFRIAATVSNTTPWASGDRDAALRRSLVSTHLVLRARGAGFVSLTDPAPGLRAHADACRNEGVWPVLVGADGARDTLLASPIILPDYPRIAPESPGDLFDAAEIDQLLVLSVLSMGEQERSEMAASDPRAREILARIDSLSPEALRRLHGSIREFYSLGEE